MERDSRSRAHTASSVSIPHNASSIQPCGSASSASSPAATFKHWKLSRFWVRRHLCRAGSIFQPIELYWHGLLPRPPLPYASKTKDWPSQAAIDLSRRTTRQFRMHVNTLIVDLEMQIETVMPIWRSSPKRHPIGQSRLNKGQYAEVFRNLTGQCLDNSFRLASRKSFLLSRTRPPAPIHFLLWRS